MPGAMRGRNHLILGHFGIVPWDILSHYDGDANKNCGFGKAV